MSSYADHAILALPRGAPERHWRFLAALGCVKPHPGGWVYVSQVLLAELMGMGTDALKLARTELVKAGVVEYRPGQGKGHWSSYRINAERPKGLSSRRSQRHAPPLNEPPKGGVPGDQKGGCQPDKRGGANRPDQQERSDCVEVLLSERTSVTPRPPQRSLLDQARQQVPGLEAGEFDSIFQRLRDNPRISSPTAIIKAHLRDGTMAGYVDDWRAKQARREQGSGVFASFLAAQPREVAVIEPGPSHAEARQEAADWVRCCPGCGGSEGSHDDGCQYAGCRPAVEPNGSGGYWARWERVPQAPADPPF